MGLDSGIYKLLQVLHILSAIVGFGGVMLNGVHGMQAKRRQGREGLAVTESTIAASNVASYFMYAVFAFGILMVLVSDGDREFSHLWISLSMGLFIVALGLSHSVLRKNVARMRDLMEELASGPPPVGAGGPPPQVAELEKRGKAVGAVSGVLDIILVIILALMVWKPL